MKKEESLSRTEQELEARAQELTHAKAELQEARSESSSLRKDLQDLQQQFSELEARRYGAGVSEEQWMCFPCILHHGQFCLFGRVYICKELTEFLPLLWPWGCKCQTNDSNTFFCKLLPFFIV